MSSAPSGPSTAFLVITFAVAIGIGLIIAYFGVTGHLGAGIP